MTAAEMVRRYHVAEKRLAEVEALIDVTEGGEILAALYLERDRLQAESFRVFIESRREA